MGLRRVRRPPRGGAGNGRPVLRDRGDPPGELVSAAIRLVGLKGATAHTGPRRRRGRRRDAGGWRGGLGAPQPGRPQAGGGHQQHRAGPGVGLDDVPGAGPQRARAVGEPHRRGPPPSRCAQTGLHRPADAPEPAVAGRLLRVRHQRRRDLGGVVDHLGQGQPRLHRDRRQDHRGRHRIPRDALAEVENLLGIGWAEDLADPDTGEIGKLRLVTDNGPCFKPARKNKKSVSNSSHRTVVGVGSWCSCCGGLLAGPLSGLAGCVRLLGLRLACSVVSGSVGPVLCSAGRISVRRFAAACWRGRAGRAGSKLAGPQLLLPPLPAVAGDRCETPPTSGHAGRAPGRWARPRTVRR